MIGPQDIDHLIQNANALGAMQASAIWAFVSMGLSFALWRSNKRREDLEDKHEEYNRVWQDIRIKEAEGDIKIAEAVRSQADAILKLNDQTTELRLIVDERLKKGV